MAENKSDKNKDKKDEEPTGEYEEKNVSVKGVRDDLYKRLMNLARETGSTMGEVTNQAFKTFLGSVEVARDASINMVDGARKTMVQVVSNMGELEISGDEIREMEKRVSFRNIKNLTIKPISDKDFSALVHSIHGVGLLTVSKNVKKSTILARCSFVEKLVQT